MTSTPLTPVQQEMLELLIQDTETYKVPPTTERLAKLRGVTPRSCLTTLVQLRAKGYVQQPYEGGPWVPLQASNGDPFILRAGVAPSLKERTRVLGDIISPVFPG